MAFYPETALASHEWSLAAGQAVTIDLRAAGPHERISWGFRLSDASATGAAVFAELALADAPAAEDWHPEDLLSADAVGMQALSRPAAWLRLRTRASGAVIQLVAPGPAVGAVA